ncbi:hypothetical protein HDU87_000872 [Geranomyces variabilis]|uniref:Velvet domain-containing protein n=1 Tax=Geranomyces variabilis TaxID=109894 RepID=A0AAD5XM53_9FUNG|nr:hypothetical protein HDU87_000872 [Geranomyces variabilis]
MNARHHRYHLILRQEPESARSQASSADNASGSAIDPCVITQLGILKSDGVVDTSLTALGDVTGMVVHVTLVSAEGTDDLTYVAIPPTMPSILVGQAPKPDRRPVAPPVPPPRRVSTSDITGAEILASIALRETLHDDTGASAPAAAPTTRSEQAAGNRANQMDELPSSDPQAHESASSHRSLNRDYDASGQQSRSDADSHFNPMRRSSTREYQPNPPVRRPSRMDHDSHSRVPSDSTETLQEGPNTTGASSLSPKSGMAPSVSWGSHDSGGTAADVEPKSDRPWLFSRTKPARPSHERSDSTEETGRSWLHSAQHQQSSGPAPPAAERPVSSTLTVPIPTPPVASPGSSSARFATPSSSTSQVADDDRLGSRRSSLHSLGSDATAAASQQQQHQQQQQQQQHQQPQPQPQPPSHVAGARDTWERVLGGMMVSSCYYLSDLNGLKGAYFVFPDLTIRVDGTFRLRMSLFNLASLGAHSDKPAVTICTVLTQPFRSYTARDYPGLKESTELSKHFSGQGLKIPIRRKQQRKGGMLEYG